MGEKVFCKGCRYLIPPVRPNLYSADIAANPDALEQLARWDQKLEEMEQAERERFQLGLPFTYKPMFYSHCRWWTDAGSDKWRTDHTGKAVVIYELAARRNASHDCPHYEAGEPEPE